MINENIKNIVKKIATDYPKTVFCGSFGLVLNGLINREVKDLDIITNTYYPNGIGFLEKYKTDDQTMHSNHFVVGNNNVLCFKRKINGIKIDVMYNIQNPPKFKEINFEGTTIRVENPESAINAKIEYVKNDQSDSSRLKHFADLVEIELTNKKEIAQLIRNSITKFY